MRKVNNIQIKEQKRNDLECIGTGSTGLSIVNEFLSFFFLSTLGIATVHNKASWGQTKGNPSRKIKEFTLTNYLKKNDIGSFAIV